MILGIFVSPATIREVLELLFSRKLARWELTHVRNSTHFIKMTKIDISSDEYRPAEGIIISLSQPTKEQFYDLMTSKHSSAKKYRDYARREFE